MSSYKVLEPHVEINGKMYHRDDILAETDFRPPVPKEEQRVLSEGEEADLGELASLLKSGHIAKVD